jgi:hypothetical protein
MGHLIFTANQCATNVSGSGQTLRSRSNYPCRASARGSQRCRPRSSGYFVCGFSGNALPIIGVGVISTLASPTVASLAFAATISLFALVALFFGIKYPQ